MSGLAGGYDFTGDSFFPFPPVPRLTQTGVCGFSFFRFFSLTYSNRESIFGGPSFTWAPM